MKLKDSTTYTNLARAFAGECQARTRYKFMVYGAEREGYGAIALLIKEVIKNEFNHARMLYTFIETATDKTIDTINIEASYPFKEKWNLLDNLRFSVEDEANEAEKIYPEFAKIARKEGFEDIAGLFDNLVQVETCHSKLFQQIYTQLRDGTIYKKPNQVKWKCVDCGYEETGTTAWTECPLCQAKQGFTKLIIDDNA
ncbi:MAG: rubrerythrin family protein [Clostridia bacterium]